MANARRHNKLVEVPELKVVGHCHILSNPRPRANKWWRDPGSRKLVDLVGVLDKADINCLGITNAGDDWLYERFTSQVIKLPAGYGFYQDERVTQVLTRGGVPYTFFKGEELFTVESHLLVLGTKFGQMYQPVANVKQFVEKVSREFHLDDALDEIEKDPLLVKIADHPYSRGGMAINGALDSRKDRIDLYEVNPYATQRENELVIEKAKKDKKPVFYGDDSHRPSQIGHAWNICEGKFFSFGNGEEFTGSLGHNLKTGKFKGDYKPTPLFALEYLPNLVKVFREGKAHHVYMLGLDHKGRELAIGVLGKIGLGKLGSWMPALYEKDVETDDFHIKQAIRTFNQTDS